MPSTLPGITARAWRGLLTGTFDVLRAQSVLRGAALVLALGAIVLVAADPVIRGFASMAEMQRTADWGLRERILAAWEQRRLLATACAYLFVDALVVAPAALVFLVAFLHHYRMRLAADGRPLACPRRLWPALLAAPAIAFAAAEIADLATLWSLWLARGGAPALPPWLHRSIFAASAVKTVAYATAAALCAGYFARWYFLTPVDLLGRAALDDAAASRARLRAAVADMLWRSKYALLVLVAYALVTLVLDQTRDAFLRQILDAVDAVPGSGWLQTALGLAISLAALALLGRACWLWPRLLLRLRSPAMPASPPPGAQTFAKWWCRILGLTPYAIVALMIAGTFHDVPPGHEALPWFVAALALIFVLALVFYLRVASRAPVRGDPVDYYQGADDPAAARRDMGVLAFAVAWGAPAMFLVARLAGFIEWTPPLTLAVVSAALATWAGVLGWLAIESRRHAVPFLLAFVAWVGVAAFFDLTDAHRVRELIGTAAPLDARALRTLFVAFAVLLLIGLALAAWWQRRRAAGIGRLAGVAVALVAITVVLFVHDRVPAPERFVDARPTLAEAIGRWAAQLPDAARKEPDERTADNAYPVFLVATEGGGIRSAYWTALVLWRLSAAIPDFHRRTFALSGASGGALGLAVYRGCTDASADAAAVRACIEEFGATDLWTQLLGGMFFEDAIAAVMPTQWCALPGCGVLGRSYWFEGALERAVPGLARGLAGPTPAAHAPHLFLGVTRVETGERVLQSDVRIFEAEFPGTRDLVTTMGADLRLSTAGHNSSRFPYTNPVGALYGPGCPEVPRALAAIGASLAARGDRGLCMQLQDGGYFDNSGARAASDLLRALIQRLPAFRCPLGLAASLADSSCAKRMEWIKPVVIEIRNNYTLAPAPDERRPPVCAPSRVSPVDPGRAEAKPPFALYPSVLTAALTTLQTRTAHMRNFEAELERDAAAAWLAQGLAVPQDVPSTCPAGVAAWLPARPFHRFDLVNDGVLFPSGWMLSQRARRGIEREAACGVPYVGDPPGDCAGAVARKR